ncbi:MAG TPA: GatB/YqeY domain-containing protein [Candidatus Paceibacterota bacterium]|nr:GatB/YqeY domain-containing protein [Candidatus Paceibacterota bacterium]
MTHPELKEAIKDAMRAKDATRLAVLRGISAAATNEAVAKGKGPDGQLTDDELMTVIIRAGKQRKDSIEQFEKGGRPELAETEKAELSIIETLLPKQMSREEVEAAVKTKAAEMGVTDRTGANKLMGMLMKDLKGKADGTIVKEIVDQLFQ